MLWTAPELLYKRHAGLNTRKTVPGTQPGDIYGFAIILQEIMYRSLPYQATGEQTMVTKGMSVAWAFNDDDDDDTVVKITTKNRADVTSHHDNTIAGPVQVTTEKVHHPVVSLDVVRDT